MSVYVSLVSPAAVITSLAFQQLSQLLAILLCLVQDECCFTSTEIIRSIRDGEEPRTASPTLIIIIIMDISMAHDP